MGSEILNNIKEKLKILNINNLKINSYRAVLFALSLTALSGCKVKFNTTNEDIINNDTIVETSISEGKKEDKELYFEEYDGVTPYWKYIDKLREANKDNINYPHVWWHNMNKKIVRVTIGDEYIDLPVEEAKEKYSDNKIFNAELKQLLDTYESNKDLAFEEDFSFASSEVNNSNINNYSFDFEEYDIEMIKQETEDAINKIVSDLGLKQSDEVMDQLKCCCLVQKYIIENNIYTDSIMNLKENCSKDDMRIIDLYNAAVLKQGVCTSNSVLFQELVGKVGIKAECIAIKTVPEGGYHCSNLVLLDGEYYYFDSTYDSTFNRYYSDSDETELCFAGLGSVDYGSICMGVGIIPKDLIGDLDPLPSNISEGSIPYGITNMFFEQPINESEIKQ